jgi:anti-sigma B factor antagonist
MFKKRQPLIFEVKMDDDIAVLKIGGRLDATNIEGVTEKFNDVIENKSTKIIIDLSELNYISSIWLGEFMAFARAVDRHNGRVIIINMDKKIYRVFDVLGFADNFTILESYEEAKQKLQ